MKINPDILTTVLSVLKTLIVIVSFFLSKSQGDEDMLTKALTAYGALEITQGYYTNKKRGEGDTNSK